MVGVALLGVVVWTEEDLVEAGCDVVEELEPTALCEGVMMGISEMPRESASPTARI